LIIHLDIKLWKIRAENGVGEGADTPPEGDPTEPYRGIR